jgi:hypothetical protein
MGDKGGGTMSAIMNNQRSPNYPQISLPDAIERIRGVYKSLGTSRASEGQILSLLGYKARSGTSQGVLSALRKYGLLEGKRDSFKITHNAIMILERQPHHPDYVEAITSAAFAPPLFSEIRENLGDKQFTDEDLRIYLVKRGFSKRALDEVIRSYRETMSLVLEPQPAFNVPASGMEMTTTTKEERRGSSYGPTGETHRAFGATTSDAFSGPSYKDFPLFLTRRQQGILRIPAEMTQRDYELLKQQIEHSLRIIEATSLRDSANDRKEEE